MSTIQFPAELRRTRWSSDAESDVFVVENPATGQGICRVQGAGVSQVDAAAEAAHEAQLRWRRKSARERGGALLAVARKLRDHADEIAKIETMENGKPIMQARFADTEACIGVFEYFGALIDKLPGTQVQLGAIDSIETLEPFGVVAGILPFNWPPIHFAAKVAAALAVGNAVLLKPGEQAPLTVMRLVELANEVLPPNLLHVLPGGWQVGDALARHKLVRKVSFTGAPGTGVKVLQAAAQNLTPTLMELGGKNALVVFNDANLTDALVGALDGAFFNKGEACTAASRLLVQRGVLKEFTERLSAAVAKLRVGDGADAATHVGPVVSRAQQQRVLDYLKIAREEGARVAAQAALPKELHLQEGFFVPPTLLADVHPDMRVAREEIFGPVTCIIPFDTEEEAVRIANDTEFGLVAAVYSSNHERTLRVARGIEAGVVFINNYNRQFIGTPFGGTKASGFGREHFAGSLREFGYAKALRIPSGREPVSHWVVAKELVGQ